MPNLTGATGLLQIPSAYVQANGEISVFAGVTSHTTGGVLVGLQNRIEVGGIVIRQSGVGSDSVATAKLNLVPEELFTPAVSVGVVNAFGSEREQPTGYVVASKDIIPYFLEALTGQRKMALKVHAGYGGGLFHHEVFAGAELVGSGGLSVLGEIAGGRANAGLRYTSHGFSATVGVIELKTSVGLVSYSMEL